MNILLKVFALLGSLLLANCSFAQSGKTGPHGHPPIAFVDVNVIPMTREGILRDQTVIIENGRISRIGRSSSIQVPQGFLRIDGRGKFLMPGLVDFHVHIRDESELLSYLVHGVTTTVQMSGRMGDGPDPLTLRQQIIEGKVLGPTVYTTGQILDGDPPIFPGVSTAVSTPDEAKQAVEKQFRAGVHFVKVYNNLTPENLRAVTDAAHARGLAVLGHIPRRQGRDQALQTALDAGLDMIAHGEEFFFTYFYGDADSRLDRGWAPQPDKTKIPLVVAMLRKSGTAVTPNLSFVAMTRRQLDDVNAVLANPEAKYVGPAVLSLWRTQNPTRRSDLPRFDLRERAKYSFLQELTLEFQKGGVLMLLGTDSSAPGMFPGNSAHLELREMVKAGLSPFEALCTGTKNAGQFIRQHVRDADMFGTIEVGRRSDLLLLDANPLESIDNIGQVTGVAIRGRWMTKSELEKMRTAIVSSTGQ